MLPVSTVFGGHAQSFGFHDQVPASRTGPSVPAATPLHPQPLLPRQPLLQPVSWASNGGEEKSPSIVREIRILRSPEPVRPRKRSDANDDRTRRRRSPSRSTRRRRDKSPSRSRGRWRSAQSRSRSRHRRKKTFVIWQYTGVTFTQITREVQRLLFGKGVQCLARGEQRDG